MIELLPNKSTMHKFKYIRDPIRPEKRCIFCQNVLIKPFIECFECLVFLCLNCFSQGTEKEKHQNNHSYIVHENVRVFPSADWTANEETLLLELIISLGYNWDDISKAMKTRSSKDCKEHYNTFYFDGIFTTLLGLTNEYEVQSIRTPHFYDLNTEIPRTVGLDFAKSKVGYRGARADFDIPYDISAESILNDLDGCFYGDWLKEIKHIGETLQCSILTVYNHRVR